MNVWIIAIDRPGMGLSDFGARWTIGNWRADAAALVDAIPDCEARFYHVEDHLSLFANHPEEIPGALIA
jgi:pimeloyl-ACP methyl ester carboxylesterase